MVFGTSPVAPIVMFLLGREPSYFGRLRDAWIEKGPDGQLRLAVYTRNGGGNREHYNDEKEEGEECHCTGCTITHHLPKDPLYLSDKDDDFDSTYATVYFKVPEDAEARLRAEGMPEDKKLSDLACEPRDMSVEWHKAIDAIKSAPVPPAKETP